MEEQKFNLKDIKRYPGFDWKNYLLLYPSLEKEGVNTEEKAIRHWLLYGRKEGRVYSLLKELEVNLKDIKRYPGFDWKNYLLLYPNLEKEGVNTEEKAIRHWLL
ncbi:MAG: hypothetical protein HQL21_03305, partial [Candidatus Omnitrophica bacterium]|nr:hypothetical protein [Candidatus Omnitrophota bacterium]